MLLLLLLLLVFLVLLLLQLLLPTWYCYIREGKNGGEAGQKK